jgi:hypothetical protein
VSEGKARRVGKRGAHKRNRNENEVGHPNATQGELARGEPTHVKRRNENDNPKEH